VFAGKLGRTTLKPGSYRFALTATDSAKNTGPLTTIAFRIR
jgi:hypothetical protein